jgi:hypothetical protein
MDPLTPNVTPPLDLLDVEALRGPQADLVALARGLGIRPPRHRQGEKFLKGPIPWTWLERAFLLPGKALHVALLLWQKAGCRRSRTVPFCLAGGLPPGLNEQSARRGLRRLEAAGLVTVRHSPGRGLEVTLNRVSADSHQRRFPLESGTTSEAQSPGEGDCVNGTE